MLIINLRTNHFENPVGYNVSPLTFSWNVEEARGTKTVEARVQIAEDITFKTVVWDSGSRDNIDSKSFMPPFTPKPETRGERQREKILPGRIQLLSHKTKE